MATAENPTNNDTDDEKNPEWEVTSDGMALRKVERSTYEIEYGGNIQRFKEVTNDDSYGYELRGTDYFTIGYFDPTHDEVPDEIGSAFRILTAEM